jgi:hypothetical protein
VHRLAHEVPDAGLLSSELAAGISRVKGGKQLGFRAVNWLRAVQSSEVLQRALGEGMRAKRDYAIDEAPVPIYWYSGYGPVDFDPKLFEKPENVKIEESQ